MNTELIITRGIEGAKETLGILQVVVNCKIVYACVTLELPYIANKKNISCIPTGKYAAMKYDSPSNGDCILLKDVPNRDMIEIHAGNFYSDIEGCVLVGNNFSDINNDDIVDVVASNDTLDELLVHLPDNFVIIIK